MNPRERSTRLAVVPSVLDRLLDAAPREPAEAAPPLQTLEQLKDSVARDLEALLNSRCAQLPGTFDAYPHAGASILGFGLIDFCGMSLAHTGQRDAICRSIADAVAVHEPRLKSVTVSLSDAPGVNRVLFSIDALLAVNPAEEPVNFSAVLQPSTQSYAVARRNRES